MRHSAHFNKRFANVLFPSEKSISNSWINISIIYILMKSLQARDAHHGAAVPSSLLCYSPVNSVLSSLNSMIKCKQQPGQHQLEEECSSPYARPSEGLFCYVCHQRLWKQGAPFFKSVMETGLTRRPRFTHMKTITHSVTWRSGGLCWHQLEC